MRFFHATAITVGCFFNIFLVNGEIMMKKLALTIAVLVGIVAYYTVSYEDQQGGEVSSGQPRIGVLQLVSHPSLDQITEGIMDTLNQAGYIDGETADIDLQNAQGDQNNLATMSSRFINQDSDILIGVATPAVQALANATSDLPIIMGAVTDPTNAGLVENLDQPGGNITGVRDVTPYEDQIDLMMALLPELESIGIIYSTGEINAALQSEEARGYAESLGLGVVEATISSTNDLQQVASNLVNQVDAIWVGTDNNVASAFPTLIEVANQAQVPVFPAVAEMVEEGGLATVGLDQYELGVLTADLAIEVLEGADPGNLPVQDPSETELIINQDQADRLNISIDNQLMEEADSVIEGAD